jgi:hypothetical protein
VNNVVQKDDPRNKLIEIAARLTDREAQHSSNAIWLKAFRKNYRHLAVTFGLQFDVPGLGNAETKTDEALDRKTAEAA